MHPTMKFICNDPEIETETLQTIVHMNLGKFLGKTPTAMSSRKRFRDKPQSSEMLRCKASVLLLFLPPAATANHVQPEMNDTC